jgi:hypothetical protein
MSLSGRAAMRVWCGGSVGEENSMASRRPRTRRDATPDQLIAAAFALLAEAGAMPVPLLTAATRRRSFRGVGHVYFEKLLDVAAQ